MEKDFNILGIDGGVGHGQFRTTGLLEYCNKYLPDVAECLRFDEDGFAYLNEWRWSESEGGAVEIDNEYHRLYIRTEKDDDTNGITLFGSYDRYFLSDCLIMGNYLEIWFIGMHRTKYDCENDHNVVEPHDLMMKKRGLMWDFYRLMFEFIQSKSASTKDIREFLIKIIKEYD